MYQEENRFSYNSDGDTTHGSINFQNESTSQINRLDDGTLEISDTLPKKEYYMSLRKNGNRLGGSMSRIGGGSNAGFGTMTGTLKSGFMGAKSQSIMDFKPCGKIMECLVIMLDGTEEVFRLDRNSYGQHLFDMICEHLELNERDYFGITFKDNLKTLYWLDLYKKITKQIPDNRLVFEFQVKFYPPKVDMITEDLTRYYLSLQVRQDLVSGELPCSFYVYVLLGSYIIQSEAGDFDPESHIGIDYVKNQPLAPQQFQTDEMLLRVVELHRLHRGQNPEEADKNFLENARKLALYGVDRHRVKNSDGDEIMIGVYHGGIVLYRQRIRIIRFSWARLIKVSYKKRKIIIIIRGVNKDDSRKEMSFKCRDVKMAKRLYKAVVDHHYFFRMLEQYIPKKPNLQPGFHTRKYYKSPQTASPTAHGDYNHDRPNPKFKRLPQIRKEQSEDGWYTLPNKTVTETKSVTVSPSPVTSSTNDSLSKFQKNNTKYYKANEQENARIELPPLHWRMSPADCTLSLGMDEKGLDVASQQGAGWQGCRANKGVKTCGEYFYEARILEDGLVRIGWSTNDACLNLGTDAFGYGYGADELGNGWGEGCKGRKLHDNESKEYGLGVQIGDYIGCRIDLKNEEIAFYKNGKPMKVAYKIPDQMCTEPLFPTLSVKDGRAEFNFGDTAFVYPPSDSETWIPLSQSDETNQVPNKHVGWKLNAYDSTKSLDISPEGLMAQAQLGSGWQGARCNKGVKGRGKYYFEATPMEGEGLARVGWSTESSNLDLGMDKYGFGYGADNDGFGLTGNQGKKLYNNDIENYGKAFTKGDVIGCLLDLDDGRMQWSLNGQIYDPAYQIPLELRNGPSAFFPTASMKNNTMEFNFGEKVFKYYPGSDWTPLTYTPEQFMKESKRRGPERKVKGRSYINTEEEDEMLNEKMQQYGGQNHVNIVPSAKTNISMIIDDSDNLTYEPVIINKTGTRTVTNGEVTEVQTDKPNVEFEEYIDEYGNLVKKTITRTKKVTRTTKTMSELVTERSENDVATTNTGRMMVKNNDDDFDEEVLRNAILAVSLMDSNASVLNNCVGSLGFTSNSKDKNSQKVIESDL